jgi:hypothetical protein
MTQRQTTGRVEGKVALVTGAESSTTPDGGTGGRPGPARPLLRLLGLVQRSGRQRVAPPRDHDAAPRSVTAKELPPPSP